FSPVSLLTRHSLLFLFAGTPTTAISSLSYTTGVAEQARPVLRTWPNPATSTLQVELPLGLAAPQAMELIDATGRAMPMPAHVRLGNVLALDVSALPSGAWVLRVLTQGGTFIARFVR